MEPNSSRPPIPITPEQSKLLESSLRIKILHALKEEPRTSKQVADLLGQSPGNVHYHIRKLHDGGLLELCRTQTAGGVVEKYYRSIGTAFQLADFQGYDFLPGGTQRRLATRLSLSEEDLREFVRQMDELLAHWEAKNTKGPEYGVAVTVGRIREPDSSAASRP